MQNNMFTPNSRVFFYDENAEKIYGNVKRAYSKTQTVLSVGGLEQIISNDKINNIPVISEELFKNKKNSDTINVPNLTNTISKECQNNISSVNDFTFAERSFENGLEKKIHFEHFINYISNISEKCQNLEIQNILNSAIANVEEFVNKNIKIIEKENIIITAYKHLNYAEILDKRNNSRTTMPLDLLSIDF